MSEQGRFSWAELEDDVVEVKSESSTSQSPPRWADLEIDEDDFLPLRSSSSDFNKQQPHGSTSFEEQIWVAFNPRQAMWALAAPLQPICEEDSEEDEDEDVYDKKSMSACSSVSGSTSAPGDDESNECEVSQSLSDDEGDSDDRIFLEVYNQTNTPKGPTSTGYEDSTCREGGRQWPGDP